jgi:choline dehydrogenase
MRKGYDYVILGAGSAGCAIAYRLSENPNVSVCVLEAGGPDRHPFIHMPAGYTKCVGPKFNWSFRTAPQKELNNRELYIPQGRTYGGSSSINGQVYIRGAKEDYDTWRDELGLENWGYDSVLRLFKKSENNHRIADDYHGNDGPLHVSDITYTSPATKLLVEAGEQYGLPFNRDFNGAQQAGIGVYQSTHYKAQRWSAARAFLHPAMKRSNLTVIPHALVTRVVVENGRALGVEYIRDGSAGRDVKRVDADVEVIVSSGTFNSPKILMMSGIGPATHLKDVGVEPEVDLPGVGQNLQDHLDINVVVKCVDDPPISFNGMDRGLKQFQVGLQYLMFRNGPVASSGVESGGYIKSHEDVSRPDLQFFLLPAYVRAHGLESMQGQWLTMHCCTLRPKSRGEIKLRSNDPRDLPILDPRFCSDPYDLKVMVAAVRHSRELFRQRAFKKYVLEERWPEKGKDSDGELEEFVRNEAETSYHPVGTCKMGKDAMAVVDERLRVRGVLNLRVADASIMPLVPSGNTNAPSIMVGEHCAEMIQRDHN